MEPKGIQHYTIMDLTMMRETIREMISFLDGYFTLNEDQEYKIRLIINELIANGFIHGNGMNEKKRVAVWLKIIPSRQIEILVMDEGAGFDYKEALKCCSEDDMMRCFLEGGRGLKLVKTMSDQMKFNKKGNKVLVKLLLSPL